MTCLAWRKMGGASIALSQPFLSGFLSIYCSVPHLWLRAHFWAFCSIFSSIFVDIGPRSRENSHFGRSIYCSVPHLWLRGGSIYCSVPHLWLRGFFRHFSMFPLENLFFPRKIFFLTCRP
jgi:hypothetical protein